jgi:hypothetical protein
MASPRKDAGTLAGRLLLSEKATPTLPSNG